MTIESKVNIIQKENLQLGLSSNIDGYYYFDNGQIYKPGFRYNSTTTKIQFSNDGYSWIDFVIPDVGGDLSGTLYNAKVIKFNNNSISLLTPIEGQVIYYDNGFYFAKIDGDVSGNITDAYVIGLNGISFDTTTIPLDGYGYVYNSSQNKWTLQQIASSVEPPVTPDSGRDCSGAVDSINVIGINNIELDITQIPTNGQVLVYNSAQSKWLCSEIGGDVSGPFDDVVIDKINGIEISTNIPYDGYTYLYDSATSKWIPDSVIFSSDYALDLFNVGGRLSLESGAAYMIDPAGYVDKTTLYWCPIRGGNVALFDGATWAMYSPGELSITTSGLDPEKIYDVFMYINTGVAYLIFGPAWTNDFTRSEELTTLNNVLVQSSTSYRYLGSIRTFGTSPVYFQYTSNNISLWNYYNRSKISAYCTPDISVDSWMLPTVYYRPFNDDENIKISHLVGIKEDCIKIKVIGITKEFTESGYPYGYIRIGIGINSTNTNVCETNNEYFIFSTFIIRMQIHAFYEDYVDIGYNSFYPLEYNNSAPYHPDYTVYMTGNSIANSCCCGIMANVFG